MESSAKGLLVVTMEVEPSADADFNRWMDDEHIGERLDIAGFVAATRFRMASDPHRYMQIYEIEGPEVLESAAYRAKMDHPSELTMQMRQKLKSTRSIYVKLSETRRREP